MDTHTKEGGEFAGGCHLKLDTGKIDVTVVTNDGVVEKLALRFLNVSDGAFTTVHHIGSNLNCSLIAAERQQNIVCSNVVRTFNNSQRVPCFPARLIPGNKVRDVSPVVLVDISYEVTRS